MTSEDAYYDAVLGLVREAGNVVREVFNRPGKVDVKTKSSAIDLVTETDQKVEKMLIDGLSSKFPDHKYIGEESSAAGQKVELTNAPTWIIDPIDGTTNFVHKLPFVGICIALYVDKKPRIGIVYNPILDELYSARAGRGAYKNGFPIHVSGTTDLGSSILMFSFGLHNLKSIAGWLDISTKNSKALASQGIRGEEPLVQNFLKNYRTLMCGGSRGHRSFGSAAINMCYLAAGATDVYLEYGLHCWDVAASGLIVQEAGGCIIDPAGGQFDLMARRILCASSEPLAKSIVGLIENVEIPRD